MTKKAIKSDQKWLKTTEKKKENETETEKKEEKERPLLGGEITKK